MAKKRKSNDGVTQNMWVKLASQAYDQSTTYVNNNYRNQWENNERHFQSRHHLGSKYNRASYAYKSKLFRPKTRSAIRANEAAAAAAFFQNMDVVSIEAISKNDILQVASADFQFELMQYRLTETIPWFVTCIGAFQDGQKMGVVISYNHWLYRENGSGQVIKDCPAIDLRPVENIRIHPAASWVDPIGSSPYIIDLIPMFVQDVKDKMRKPNHITGKKWLHVDDGELKSARKQMFDSTRQERIGQRTDPYDTSGSAELSEYDTVWVHRNIVRFDDEEIVYYTLGTEKLLTEPVFLEEEYPHLRPGERPYVMGVAVIEAHKIYPSGVGQLAENIQKEINENVNQRLDNVKLALNKRWFVRRGSQVNIKTLTRNVAASVTMMGDIEKDVRAEEFTDVTGSAYAEQDRLNVDFDEVTGNFSAGTIQTNRKLNETVGGIAMLRGESTGTKEYLVRTFGETWAKPTMKQLLEMLKTYETDEVILGIAAARTKSLEKLGIPAVPQILHGLLEHDLKTTINVGIGATDPVMKINNFRLGLESVTSAISTAPPGFYNIEELSKEIFGRIGYDDGSRFVNLEQNQDPEKTQLSQMVQQLQAQLESKMDELHTKIMVQQIKDQEAMKRLVLEIQGDKQMKLIDRDTDIILERVKNRYEQRSAR